jgi:hypothetical protein
LFSILVAADQPKDAVRRASRWLKGGRDEGLALALVEMLVRAGRQDAAIELAREVGVPGDAISLTVAEIMLDRQQTTAAQSYLRGWLDRASLKDERMLVRFIEASLDAEDPALALRAADKAGLDDVPEAQLVGIAEALAAIGDRAGFDKVLSHLRPETIAANPLIASAAALNGGERQSAETLLAKVEPDALQDWRLALWARLMESNGKAIAAGQALHRLGVETPPAPPPAAAPPAAVASSAKELENTVLQRARSIHRQRARRARYRFRSRGVAVGTTQSKAAPKPASKETPFLPNPFEEK